jgi:hypothetical protein
MTEIEELRARVEALEATQHAHVDTRHCCRASHLTDAKRKQIQEELARPATFAELLMPPPRTTTPVPLFTAEEVARIVAPITRDRDETGDYLNVHDTPAPASLVETMARLIANFAITGLTGDDATPSADRMLALQDQIRDGELTLTDALKEIGAAPIRSGPESPLVERVADAIGAADDEGLTNMTWSNHSRAAILEVAGALIDWHDSDQVFHTAWEAAKWLEREANR